MRRGNAQHREGKGTERTGFGRRQVVFGLCAVLCLLAGLWLVPKGVEAESVTDDLEIRIGYWGTDESQYVTKAHFHWTDLQAMYGGAENMPLHAYSYFKGKDGRSYKLVVVSARGAYLEDVLNYAGVNISDVSNISFFTSDFRAGAFASFTPYQLLEEPRYYYDNLAAHINNRYNGVGMLTGYDIDPSAESCREPVPTMLALESNWSEFEAGAENTDPVWEGMMTSSRFRLLFGQNAADETNMTGKSAKYVHTIALTIPGSPEVKNTFGGGGGKVMLSTEIGKHTVTFDVAADEAMLEDIMNNLEWQSSDDRILRILDKRMQRSAEYDDAVTVQIDYEVLKKGKASITGNYMGVEVGSGGAIATDENAPQDQPAGEEPARTDPAEQGENKAPAAAKPADKPGDGTRKSTKKSLKKSGSAGSGAASGAAGDRDQGQRSKGNADADRKLSLTNSGGRVTASNAGQAPAESSGLVAMDLEDIFAPEPEKPQVSGQDGSRPYMPFLGAGAGVILLFGGTASALQFRAELGEAALRLRRRKL